MFMLAGRITVRPFTLIVLGVDVPLNEVTDPLKAVMRGWIVKNCGVCAVSLVQMPFRKTSGAARSSMPEPAGICAIRSEII